MFGCKVHGTCTLANRAPGVRGCCKECTHYNSAPFTTLVNYAPVGKRHLVYYVLPVSQNGVWQRGIDQLRLRWNLFTGRKVVVVAKGGPVRERTDATENVGRRSITARPLDAVDTVRRFLPAGCEVLVVDNDALRWELAGWDVAWPSLFRTAGDDDAVFYGHAKGSTRKVSSPCQIWADLLYRIGLDHWSVVESVLSTRPLVGAMLRKGKHFPKPNEFSRWHYAGNFWWSRIGPLKERLEKYSRYLVNGHSAEAWLGMAFDVSDAGSIFTSDRPTGYLYSPGEVTTAVSEYSKWLTAHVPETYC